MHRPCTIAAVIVPLPAEGPATRTDWTDRALWLGTQLDVTAWDLEALDSKPAAAKQGTTTLPASKGEMLLSCMHAQPACVQGAGHP
jgi:hypothetical protein